MLELYNLGFAETNLKNMIDSNPEIIELEEIEIVRKIEYLKHVGCTEVQIKNILIGNPWYFSRILTDVMAMIQKLKDLKFEAIHLMIDSHPFLLNIDCFEIDDFIERKQEEGYEIDDILDMIDENPMVITE